MNWKGSLYNNIGWTYHEKENYAKALDYFQKGVVFRESQDDAYALYVVKWTVGRAHRSLKNYDKALEIQLDLNQRNEEAGKKDGYVAEELAEIYLVKDEKEKEQKYFKIAYQELSKDNWFVKNESKRLDRIKELAK